MNYEHRKGLLDKLAQLTASQLQTNSEMGHTIDQMELAKALSGAGAYPNFNHFFVDDKYRILKRDDWLPILDTLHVREAIYEAEFYDCDDFALTAKGLMSYTYGINGVGWVINYGGEHSYLNVAIAEDIDDNGKVKTVSIGIVEPQTDEFRLISQEHYKPGGGGLVLW